MKEIKLCCILDPAHGRNVIGKMSPDGLHKEYEWSRKRCKELERILKDNGYKVEYTTTSDNEPGLTFRKNIASSLKANGLTKLLISLHNNGAGDGTQWLNATGVEIYTTPGKTKSDDYAKIVYDQLQKDFPNLKFRGLKEADFTVLKGSGYYAMLIEWLFQDNKKDIELLEDDKINKKLINSIFIAIETINNSL